MNGDCNLWICFDLFLKTLVFFLGGVCDGSPVLPATAGQWVWLGDSSREPCTPVLPSIKLRLCWHGCPGSCLRLVFVYFGLCCYFKLGSV